MFRRAGRTNLRDFGRVFIGLGLILLALRLMTDCSSELGRSFKRGHRSSCHVDNA